MDERIEQLVRTYFQTMNSRDETAHAALYAPTVTYFGSESGLASQGLGTIRGVFRAAWSSYGVRGCVPTKVFGRWPEVAVLVEILGGPESAPESMTEGVFYLILDEAWKIQKVSILWDFSPIAKRMLAGD